MKDNIKGLIKYICTHEDWHPTENGKVRVRCMLLSDGAWRVCVWGADDFGLELDFHPKPGVSREEEAVALFNRIKDGTTKRQLRDWGLHNA